MGLFSNVKAEAMSNRPTPDNNWANTVHKALYVYLVRLLMTFSGALNFRRD